MGTSENSSNNRSARMQDGSNQQHEDGSQTGGGGPRLYHTLTACTRCRSRKTRCDAGLPKCGPCERTGAHCEFFDSAMQKTIPRSYVVHLQNKVRALEEEIARREAQLSDTTGSPNTEELVRAIGAVKFEDYDEHFKEPRYVGPSSGVTVTRLVLESVKNDLDPEEFIAMTALHRNTFKNGSRTSQSPDPNFPTATLNKQPVLLPPRNFGEKLVSLFCQKSLYMLPVLHEPTFLREVADVYEGSTDPFKTFKLKMVLAISLQKYSVEYSDWADKYFLSGLRDLDKIMEPMDHSTLQCLLVMVQFALVKPTRIAAYHIVGLCVRLCIQLGYHQERTIMLSETPLDPITKDMRRRLFWALASMEYGLSQVLGRPSAFATSDAHIDVKFYEPVDDKYITAGGILPGPESAKKLISMHFFRMRRLQAEIRHILYQNPRDTPKTDEDPWFTQMREKCDKWKASCPAGGESSGLSKLWFDHRYNNIIIFMYRPSPQIPQPSVRATRICFNCAVKNVYIENEMVEGKTVDLTWVFMHQVYTVTLTIIWAVYCPEIRKRNSREQVQAHIDSQIKLLTALNERWPGADAAADLFSHLARAAMKNYDTDLQKSPASSTSTRSPPSQFAPSPPGAYGSSPPQPSPLQPLQAQQQTSDITGMLSDPTFIQNMFFNSDSAHAQFFQSWDTPQVAPASQQTSPYLLDPAAQNSELDRILRGATMGGRGGWGGYDDGGSRGFEDDAVGRVWR